MPSNPKISFAQITDVPALVSLINSAYRGDGSKKGWTFETDLFDGLRIDEKTLTELLSDKNAVILKYTNSNDITGCVYLQKQKAQS